MGGLVRGRCRDGLEKQGDKVVWEFVEDGKRGFGAWGFLEGGVFRV